MKFVICAISILLGLFQNFVNCSTQTWLLPCVDSKDCSSLKNATCSNGFCECGEKFYVCETNVNQIKVNQIGGQCDNTTRICNAIFSECGQENVCACKEGFVASSDFKRCLNVALNMGDHCERDVECTSSAFGDGSLCLRGVCRCKDDHHYKAKNRKCVPDLFFDDICGSSEDCHQPGQESRSRLMCIEGVCKCKLDYTEERGYCKEKNAGSAQSSNRKLQFLLMNMILLLRFYCC